MKTTNQQSRIEPPGPVERSILGSLYHFRNNPSAYLTNIWKAHGDLVKMRFGPYTVYFINHPDYIKETLVDNHKNYVKGRMYATFERFMGKGLMTNEGESWVRQRRLLQPYFQPAAVKSSAEKMTDAVSRMLDRWHTIEKSGETLDVNFETVSLALQEVGLIYFSMDLSEYANYVIPNVKFGISSLVSGVGTINDAIPNWVPTPYHRRTKSAQKMIHTVCSHIIADHRRGLHGESDLVSLLLRDCAEGNITEQQVHDELATIFLAGHDSTAAIFSWLFYLLSKHPDVQRQLQAEVDAVLNGRTPTVEDIPYLPYTKKVIMETLRLYPVAWSFPRDMVEDDEIGGYHLKGNSSVFTSPYLIHRHPDFWENPEAFLPERFNAGWEKTQHRYAYVPFGLGQRVCPAQAGSIQSLMLSLPMIMQRFSMATVPQTPVMPTLSMIMHPDGLRIKIKSRG